MTTPEQHAARLARLPAWARDELDRRAREVDRLAELVLELTDAKLNPIAVRSPYRDPVGVAWDRYDEIRFAVEGTSEDIAVSGSSRWIGVRRRVEGEIEISGGSGITVTPQSSNVVIIRPSTR